MRPIARQLLSIVPPLLLGLTAPASADPQRHPAPQPTVRAPEPRALHPALWKVADADTTIYLFGTIHVLPAGLTWFDGPLADAFARSGSLVTELPELKPADVGVSVLRLSALPKGQTLRALLPKKERALLEAQLRAYKLGPDHFDPVKPWFAAISLLLIQLERAGFGKERGVEAELASRAAQQGKPRAGLETLDQQLGQFDTLPLKAQRAFLRGVIEAGASTPVELGSLVDEWGQGHAAELAALIKEDAGDPQMSEALLAGRNRTWAAWIKARLDQPGTVFVAVGAGHLAGKGSVQDDLAAVGIQTVRVQ